MPRTIHALYDGSVFRPDQPPDLPPNTRVLIQVESEGHEPVAPYSFLRFARSLNMEGPADWSERVEEELYGDKTGRAGSFSQR